MRRNVIPLGMKAPSDWPAEPGYRAASAVAPETTAVFSGNDQTALGLIHGLVDLGRRVPHDVSVVGFDDVPEARFYLPALTTVRQDFEQVGRVAVESLIRQIEGGSAEHIAPLEARLIVRESTARPARFPTRTLRGKADPGRLRRAAGLFRAWRALRDDPAAQGSQCCVR